MDERQKLAKLIELEIRLERIEARQRIYEMHDPSCEAGQLQRDRRRALEYGLGIPWWNRPCTCWLKETE